jgi:type IV pilus assembly protein PilN
VIKINLAGSKKISSSSFSSPAGGDDAMPAGDNKEIQKQGFLRLFVILILPAILYTYQNQNIPVLQAKLQSKRNLLQTLTSKNEQAKNAVEEIKKFKEDQAQLQKQITTLESLRKDRLREVKILDNLQKDLPEKIWLSKINLEANRMQISGTTVSDLELSSFMDNLSKSIFLKRVNLIRSSDLPFNGGLQTKSFEISCDLESISVAGSVPSPNGGSQ